MPQSVAKTIEQLVEANRWVCGTTAIISQKLIKGRAEKESARVQLKPQSFLVDRETVHAQDSTL